jgi:hypothetical protein
MTRTLSIRTASVTRAAVLLALLIAWQYVSAPLGITLVTGSGVNMILACCVMTCGYAPGLLMAVISPFMARLFGIGPSWALVPFIAAGNLVFALAWRLVSGGGYGDRRDFVRLIAAAIVAAALKFVTLYFAVVKFALPVIVKPNEKQAAVLSATFSVPQLVTALIGGALAVTLLTALRQVISRGGADG